MAKRKRFYNMIDKERREKLRKIWYLEFPDLTEDEFNKKYEELSEEELRSLFESSDIYTKLKNLMERYAAAEQKKHTDTELIRTKTIGVAIKEIRLKRGMTQKELAQMAGMSEPAIRNYELGNRTPSEERLDKIANALGCQFSIIYYIECSIEG